MRAYFLSNFETSDVDSVVAELLIIIHLLEKNGEITLPGSRINESCARRVRASDGVEQRLREHRVRKTAVVDHEPNVFLLENMPFVNNENI